MSEVLNCAAFAVGAAVSLATSWVLVSRLERIGEMFGLTEALLGVVAALAADVPEITASITALVHDQPTVGAGVVLGSNVFNLAALLGLGAVVAGRIRLHQKVVVFSGTVAVVIGVACLLSVGGHLSAAVGLAVVLAVLVPYVALLGAHRRILGWLGLPVRWTAWLEEAIVEEESEIEDNLSPKTGHDCRRARRWRSAGCRDLGQRGHGTWSHFVGCAFRRPGDHRRRPRPCRRHQPS